MPILTFYVEVMVREGCSDEAPIQQKGGVVPLLAS